MVLMLRLFGISNGSDIYLLAMSVILSWHFISLLFIAQFIPFYNDLKVKSENSAHAFYNQVLVFSLVVGVVLFSIFFVFLQPVIHVYTLNLDAERFFHLYKILKIMLFSLIFLPVFSTTEQLLIAEKKFFMMYLLHIILVLVPVITMGVLLYKNNPDINILASMYSVGMFISALTGVIYCAVKIIPFKFVFKTQNFKNYILNSFTMTSGNAIVNCLLPIVINNFLVNFSNGVISCFYYSKNGIEAVNTILLDYTKQKLTSDLSENIAQKRVNQIKQIIKKYVITAPVLFFVFSLAVYFLIPLVLRLILFNSNICLDEKLFANIFLALIPWYTLGVLVQPYLFFNILSKKSFVIISANLLYVGISAIILSCLPAKFYYLCTTLFATNIISFIIYVCSTKRTTKRMKECLNGA